ncbi:putative uncharacterized protein [Prevotella sp. CAG:617]|nr:putative uncharacterized protein [Prevotella sp. CAG:617]
MTASNLPSRPTLHWFNPWHDDALAVGSPYYNPSRFSVRMERALAVLPAWWAAEGDIVHTPQPPSEAWLQRVGSLLPRVRYADCVSPETFKRVEPWGWDARLCFLLRRMGWQGRPYTDPEALRALSSRATAVRMLPRLTGRHPMWTGRSCLIKSLDELPAIWKDTPEVIVKAPWSCSGRGTRYITPECTESERGWMSGILRRQGCLEVEPYYRRLADFAMEFNLTSQGAVYDGLSVFITEKGNYAGNRVCTEEQAQQLLQPHVQPEQLQQLRQAWTEELNLHVAPHYHGPLGIDMMAVDTPGGVRLHPCVEINLRRTMGWVALRLRRLLPPGSTGRMFVSDSRMPASAHRLPLAPEEDGPYMYLELTHD